MPLSSPADLLGLNCSMAYDYTLMCIDRGYAEASDKGRHSYLPGDMSGRPHRPKEPVGARATLGPFEVGHEKASGQ